VTLATAHSEAERIDDQASWGRRWALGSTRRGRDQESVDAVV